MGGVLLFFFYCLHMQHLIYFVFLHYRLMAGVVLFVTHTDLHVVCILWSRRVSEPRAPACLAVELALLPATAG